MAIRVLRAEAPEEKAFINANGKDEVCHATGREGLINGFWWPEYVDSTGSLYYGR